VLVATNQLTNSICHTFLLASTLVGINKKIDAWLVLLPAGSLAVNPRFLFLLSPKQMIALSLNKFDPKEYD
jgi:hypothetical protein